MICFNSITLAFHERTFRQRWVGYNFKNILTIKGLNFCSRLSMNDKGDYDEDCEEHLNADGYLRSWTMPQWQIR